MRIERPPERRRRVRAARCSSCGSVRSASAAKSDRRHHPSSGLGRREPRAAASPVRSSATSPSVNARWRAPISPAGGRVRAAGRSRVGLGLGPTSDVERNELVRKSRLAKRDRPREPVRERHRRTILRRQRVPGAAQCWRAAHEATSVDFPKPAPGDDQRQPPLERLLQPRLRPRPRERRRRNRWKHELRRERARRRVVCGHRPSQDGTQSYDSRRRATTPSTWPRSALIAP